MHASILSGSVCQESAVGKNSFSFETSGSGYDDMLQYLVDSVKTEIISLDGESRIRVFNAAMERLFSLPRMMAIGRHINEIGRMMDFDSAMQLCERIFNATWAVGAALDLDFGLINQHGNWTSMRYAAILSAVWLGPVTRFYTFSPVAWCLNA